MHGKDISIPKGTEVPTFVDGNFQLDLSRFQPSVTTTQAQATSATASNAEIDVTSNPSGADIELDGTFVGNTPSTIEVSAGDHTIDVQKAGYTTWERKIKVTSGKISLNAELEAAAKADTAPTQSGPDTDGRK